jgi:hypothetical protein
MLPYFERPDAIGSYRGNPKTRTFAELLIDCEEDRMLLAVLVPQGDPDGLCEACVADAEDYLSGVGRKP